MSYIGRFAPSPTGPLHAGSLVAALASYLDARAHHGQWLIRIEDIDETRTLEGAADDIIHTLAALGMQSDETILWQSQRQSRYEAAFIDLGNSVYPCACSRKEIAYSRVSLSNDGAAIYPGTCRSGLPDGRSARAWRLRGIPILVARAFKCRSGNFLKFRALAAFLFAVPSKALRQLVSLTV